MQVKSENSQERLWTVPNIISFTRILAIIPIVYFLRYQDRQSDLIAFFLMAYAYVTDFLDGFLARLLHQETILGRIIDPIGDKLLAVTVSAVLYIQSRLPFAFFVIILSRDIIISFGAIYAMNTRKLVLPALFWGKIATVVLGFVLCCYPLVIALEGRQSWYMTAAEAVVKFGTWVSAFLLVLSLFIYAFQYYKNMNSVKESKI